MELTPETWDIHDKFMEKMHAGRHADLWARGELQLLKIAGLYSFDDEYDIILPSHWNKAKEIIQYSVGCHATLQALL